MSRQPTDMSYLLAWALRRCSAQIQMLLFPSRLRSEKLEKPRCAAVRELSNWKGETVVLSKGGGGNLSLSLRVFVPPIEHSNV